MLVRGQACNWNWSLPMSKLPPLFLLLLLLLFYTPGSASASKWPCLSLFFRTMPTLSPAISSIHVEEARWGQVDCSLRICARVHVRRDNDSSLLPLRIRCYGWHFEQPYFSRIYLESDFLLFRIQSFENFDKRTNETNIIGDVNYGIS